MTVERRRRRRRRAPFWPAMEARRRLATRRCRKHEHRETGRRHYDFSMRSGHFTLAREGRHLSSSHGIRRSFSIFHVAARQRQVVAAVDRLTEDRATTLVILTKVRDGCDFDYGEYRRFTPGRPGDFRRFRGRRRRGGFYVSLLSAASMAAGALLPKPAPMPCATGSYFEHASARAEDELPA